MTLNDLLSIYTGNACISIDGYCEEVSYDYYTLPDEEEEDFSGNNRNHYIPTCLAREEWYKKIKDRKVKSMVIIGGESYEVELCIELWE